MPTNPLCPNPRRVAAGRKNRQKRGPLTSDGRARLRQAALQNQPWRFSTGPRTPEGKAQAVRNGKSRQKGKNSIREFRAALAELTSITNGMVETRRLVAKMLRSQI